MPTPKQKKTAKELINNMAKKKPDSGGKMLENVGYADSVARYPKRVLSSQGVREELDMLGFNEYEAKRKIAEIIMAEIDPGDIKPADILRAADMVFRTFGTYPAEKHQIITADLSALLSEVEKAEIANKLDTGHDDSVNP